MVSSMYKKAVTVPLLLASAATLAATASSQIGVNAGATAAQPVEAAPAPVQYRQPQAVAPAQIPGVSPFISSAIERWRSLRQTDALPFSSYASFLTSHRGWPGEASLRRTAERAINPETTNPSEVVSYFRILPPTTNVGHARHAFALLASGDVAGAREAARRAWAGGVLPQPDEERLLSLFGAALTQQDHDRRMEALLDNGDRQSAARTLPLASAGRRPVYEARLALQGNAPDAAMRLGAIGSAAGSEAGVIMDRANWLRSGQQSAAARALLAQPRTLSVRPQNAEKWFETLLNMARGAASDRNWLTAYQIASQIDDAYPADVRVIDRSADERDHYTSLAWLAGTTAMQRLNRPADAAQMFLRYARGGRSSQVASKGFYWAGRAAEAAGQPALASQYFGEAAAFPELFYGQLALERLGRPVPAPGALPLMVTEAERAEFERRPVIAATRTLGLMGRWDDQSLFIRALADGAENERDRMLLSDFASRIGRKDLGVWVARSARNAGQPFYTRAGYPEVAIPPAQSRYWSLANGIIRQESSFDRAAVSGANARGMMQLMAPTAREVSGKLGLPYDFGRLTQDPAYNVTIGSRYFEQLVDYWGGSVPLAVASYNAGMGNVRKWVREFGDPRLPGTDIVRWIEDIPFSETRGYVQRVLENAVVYEAMSPERARTPERTRLSYYLGKPGRPG
jgi:soluble lytic murein transglycosylase